MLTGGDSKGKEAQGTRVAVGRLDDADSARLIGHDGALDGFFGVGKSVFCGCRNRAVAKFRHGRLRIIRGGKEREEERKMWNI